MAGGELSVPREKFYQRLKEEGLYEDETEADDSASKKYDASILKTAGEKIISMEARTSKEAGGEEKAVADKAVSMEPESSKEAGTAARATAGFNSPVKTETVAVSDIGVSSENGSKNDRPVRKKRSYLRLGKVAGVAGVCLLCVFAASMTSEANRNYWVRGFKYLTGNDTKVIVDNDENNEIANVDEDKAIQDIEDKIGVKVPEFYYRPDGMKLLDYVISEETSVVQMEYQCEETILMLYINKQNDITSSNIYSLHGDVQESIVAGDEKTKVAIEKVYDEGEDTPSYTANWTKDDVMYALSGRIDINELKKIIKEMRF